MERFKETIRQASLQELEQLVHDLSQDKPMLHHYAKAELDARQTDNCKFCANCGADIRALALNNVTIVFGPPDFRKKATLCGSDCLDAFLERIKAMNEKTLHAPVQ